MLQGLDKVGVHGLGVLADGPRKPAAVKHPLLEPADWRGITFGTEVGGPAQAIEALGASPAQRRSRKEALSAGEIQGFEMTSSQLRHRRSGAGCTVRDGERQLVAANGCPARQIRAARRVVRSAARLARRKRPGQPPNVPSSSSTRMPRTCKGLQLGARFANASKDDLARSAPISPRLRHMEQDAQTKAFIEQIQELKQSTPAGKPLAIPAGCGGKAPAP